MPQVFSSVKEAVAGVKRRASCSLLQMGGSPSKEETITTTIKLSDVHEAEEVDITHYTQDDLERLRFEDPFLYYSIPAMKRGLFRSDSSRSTNSSSSRRSSCPTILLNSDASDNGPQQEQRRESVTRARRLSVEPHPSLFIQDLMNEMDVDFDDSDIDEEDEKLIQALANGTFDIEDS
ncbi:hypothetical protein QTG54_007659 [Skeletonema marinoi]|uniref:Uncharacterized protein n=1 Tax=Skeletonema marinoi TaxID=267567 RepID=A0AAD8Y940_9STRA|nr:hypothetical protein QTG54_016188 [Skeletonema marinoi]KAK1742086.1 hypothetical protein QTG54_007659 [Skeletonema marinoi]